MADLERNRALRKRLGKAQQVILEEKRSISTHQAGGRGPRPLSPPLPDHTPVSDAEEIRKPAALRDEGILTEEEFAAKKRQLLGI